MPLYKRFLVNKQHLRNHLATTHSDVESGVPTNILPSHTSGSDLTRGSVAFSFLTFIYNRKNEFPFSVAKTIADNPQNPPYNPFLICGRGECGKTHLLRAMVGEMSAHLQRENIFYGSVADLAAMQAEMPTPEQYRHKLLQYKAICLDNTKDLSKYPSLQEDLAAITAIFKESKKPFVMTLDEGLTESSIHVKLRSCLETGLMVHLKKPDLDVRLRYATAESSKLHLALKKELLFALGRRFANFRNIKDIINKISAFNVNSKRPITHGDFEKILRHADIHSGKQTTPEQIIAYVAEKLGVSPEEIIGSSRQANIVFARQICMYIYRKLMGGVLTSICTYFGGKNHATILYACKKIEKLKDSDKTTNTILTQIHKKFIFTT